HADRVRHGGPVRFVLRIYFVAKSPALRIEYAGEILGGSVFLKPAQHVDHAIDRTGRLALRVAQIRQGVESAIQIRRTVDEEQRFHQQSREWGDINRATHRTTRSCEQQALEYFSRLTLAEEY